MQTRSVDGFSHIRALDFQRRHGRNTRAALSDRTLPSPLTRCSLQVLGSTEVPPVRLLGTLHPGTGPSTQHTFPWPSQSSSQPPAAQGAQQAEGTWKAKRAQDMRRELTA